MKLYITAETNVQDVRVDGIEIKLHDGKIVILDWVESEHGVVDGIYFAKFKGLQGYFEDENNEKEEYEFLNGKISLFMKPFKITDMQLYSEEVVDEFIFKVLTIEMEDNGLKIAFNKEIQQ